MGGRDRNGIGRVRVRWIGVGVLGLGLLTQSCGKTERPGSTPHVIGEAGGSPVVAGGARFDGPTSAGESPGGAFSVSGAAGAGGTPGEAGALGEAGAGGMAPEPRRPITARIVDEVAGGIEGMKLYIAGETFVSDADGIVHAAAPFGAYDALVLDTDAPTSPREYTTGIHLYEGLTTDHPQFSIYYDYADQFLPESKAAGTLLGTYPDGLTTNIGFSTPSPQFITASGKIANGAYTAKGEWYFQDALAGGTLMALLWSPNADNLPTGFWFGQSAFIWGPSIPITTNIPIAPIASKAFKVQTDLPPGVTSLAYIHSGTSAWVVSGDALTTQTFVLPAPPFANPALSPTVLISYGAVSGYAPLAWLTVPFPTDTDTLTIHGPPVPTLLEPADGAGKVAATTPFTFSAVPDTCHEVLLDTDYGYHVIIHTTRNELAPPDLSGLGITWQKRAAGTWSVTSTGPCSSIDALVAPADAVPDHRAQFSLGSRTFTTAR